MLQIPDRYNEYDRKHIFGVIHKFLIDDDYLSFSPFLPKAGLGFRYVNAPASTKDNSEARLEFSSNGSLSICAVGYKSYYALFLHTFLRQYRKSGAVLPELPPTCFVEWQEVENGPWRRRDCALGETAARVAELKAQYGGRARGHELDENWRLPLLLTPMTSREQLLERLCEADARRASAWGEYAGQFGSLARRVCFDDICYRRYLSFPHHAGSPMEPPVATHEDIVGWLHQGGRVDGCCYCMIDRRDGSWSIYGWNDGDGVNRYPPDELIRYYDLNMAYEYLLNAAIDAIVTY